MYSVSWDCDEGYTRIVVSEGSGYDIQVLSAQGRLSAAEAAEQGLEGRTVFETDYAEGLLSVRALAIDGRSVQSISRTVQTGAACSGERVFAAYGAAPEAAAPEGGAPVAGPAGPAAGTAPFVDPLKDPLSYVERYVGDESYREWFDETHAEEYGTICGAVGLADGCVEQYIAMAAAQGDEGGDEGAGAAQAEGGAEGDPRPPAGSTTVLPPGDAQAGDGAEGAEGAGGMPPGGDAPAPAAVDGEEEGGGCLVATAAYGTELAPQVQALREVRDATLLQSGSGAAFMSAFGAAYYAFSPAVADLERESPALRAAVALLVAPAVYALSAVMPTADAGSEASVVLHGIASIAAVAGMYVAAPAYAAHRARLSLAARRRAA